ncbi:WhiB family transcriptional regulator [Nonomuraea sp. B12E4]|uniref:WhiB family transcriptional regulator n=1 Tax=Nonomuraea sp. B12E4 TaxID=3153564 RepID=UPI00325E34D8
MTGWRTRGACLPMDPDVFFSDGPARREAKQACASCPVIVPCTFDALRVSGIGYQAGMSGAERDRVRRWDRQQRARIAREAS